MLSRYRLTLLVLLVALSVLPASAQNTEQLQVGPPPLHRAEPPALGASAEQLESSGDQLRVEKNFLDAVDYYEAALKKSPNNAALLNKMGICQLMLQRYKEARKSFERCIKSDRKHADAYNNLGVIYYQARNYNKAIKQYEKAIALKDDAGSYYSNRGAAYFGKREFDKASLDYSKAMEIDPDIFERTSRAGVMAQLPSPEDRARYDYVLAKLYAKMGVAERSLHYLKKAMEEGYKDIKDVYKDNEFTELRKDPRFSELMAAKTPAIQE
ncbi:MAG: tetratricopeptide repeat protein [Acidobacteriia bacterium]|jgi:tetratricopeptide (TPR) repeat protein|nr:tetratricopeptide repeat protein [Terriglobia bacterium]